MKIPTSGGDVGRRRRRAAVFHRAACEAVQPSLSCGSARMWR